MATTKGQEVSTVNVMGRPYVTVVERVRVANETAKFQVIESEPIFAADGRAWVRVRVMVDDRMYTGTSEIKFNAAKGTADASAPYECAETSAVGRALAFAGIGVIDGIASADEMMRVEQNGGGHRSGGNNSGSNGVKWEDAPALEDVKEDTSDKQHRGLTQAQLNAAKRYGADLSTLTRGDVKKALETKGASLKAAATAARTGTPDDYAGDDEDYEDTF